MKIIIYNIFQTIDIFGKVILVPNMLGSIVRASPTDYSSLSQYQKINVLVIGDTSTDYQSNPH